MKNNLNRLLPLITPLAVFGLLEIFYFYHRAIYPAAILMIFLIIITLWQFTRASLINKDWWNFSLLPVLFTFSVVSYSVLLKSGSLIQLMFVIDLVMLYFYLKFCYYYLIKPSSYKVSAIENLSSYINFVSFFLAASTIYGLQSYLNIPVWQLMIALCAISLLAVYQIMWANKIDMKKGATYLMIISVVLLEIGWAISFLPLNFNISGLILAICYYVLVGLSRLYLLDLSDKEKTRLYLLFGLSSIILIFLTSRWL